MKDYSVIPRHELLALRGITAAEWLLYGDKNLTEEEKALLDEKISRRLKGEPLQYIVGETEFCGYKIKVSPAVLIPRLDTEVLIEKAVALAALRGLSADASDGVFSREVRLLDMCTGSGCIAIAATGKLSSLGFKVSTTACDVSAEALSLAASNAALNEMDKSIRFYQGDLFFALPSIDSEGGFDMILSNPPYIPPSVIEELDSEVKDFEPRLALDGGEDGLVFYRRIVSDSVKYLKRGGILVFEIGCEQGEAVSSLMAEAGFSDVCVSKDLAGLDRVVSGRLG